MNILKKFSIEKFKDSLKNIFKRFPLSAISSLIIFFIVNYLIYNGRKVSNIETYLKIILSLLIFYFLSIGFYLLGEKLKFNKLKIYLLQIFSFIFSIYFYFSLSSDFFSYYENIIFIITILLGIISFIFISPFLPDLKEKKFDNKKYYIYLNEIFSAFFRSALLGIFLLALGFLALFAIFALFDLDDIFDKDKLFAYWTSFSFALFSLYYFLSEIPKLENLDIKKFDEIKNNKKYNFSNNYLSLPFIIVYFVILYAYTIKILLTFSWPHQTISWMIIFFSLFGYFTYIISFAFEEKSNLVKYFRKFFPFAVLFQTPIGFYAIYLRISEYGFTINRYLVLVFLIFLVFSSLHFIFSKKKSLIAIFLNLFIFIILISIGPWSVYSVPEKSQLEMLKNNLEQAGILKNGKIIPLKNKSDIDKKLASNIYSEIEYICNVHKCDSLEKIFGKIYTDSKDKNKYKIIYNILNKINVERVSYYNSFFDETIDIYLENYSLFPLKVEGYKEILPLKRDYFDKKLEKYFKLDVLKREMILYENGKLIEKVDLKEIFKDLKEKYEKNKEKTSNRFRFALPKEDLTFFVKNKYLIIFKNISFPENFENSNKKNFYLGDGIVLVK